MQNSDIKLAIDALTVKAAELGPYYAYYEGRHPDNFSSEKFKNKFGKRLQTLRENLCRTVVKAPASRLDVIGFQSESDDIQNAAWQIWKANRMPLNSGKVHREAIKTGEAFCIVWPDAAGRPIIHTQTAANIVVWKNAENGVIERAAKRWDGSDGFAYLTLYYPDRIEKYISNVKGKGISFAEFIPRTGEPFPLKNPFGVAPVFQFCFDEEANDRSNSILSDVIPLNDALNKSYADIFVAQEFNAIRQRWVTGVQFERDAETGKPLIPYDFDSQAWTAEQGDARFGEFSDANIEQMLRVKQETVRDIALVSGIPPSYFNLEQTGSAISGEALRKLEARFTSIVQESQRSFGETWSEALSFAMNISGSAVSGEIETQWSDASPVAETEQLDNALKKKNLGWSTTQIQRDFGLGDDLIAEMAESNAAAEKMRVETAAKFFDSGNSLPE